MATLPARLYLLLVAASAIVMRPGALYGQSVAGRASNHVSGAPIARVDVTLLDSAGVAVATTGTGEDGTFALRAGLPGRYRVRFQVPGYRMLVSAPLDLAVGQDLVYSLELTPVPAEELDTLLVEGRPVSRAMAGFYRRRSNSSWGNFLTRDEFLRWGPVEVTDIFRHTPQISVLPDPRLPGVYRLVGNTGRRAGGQCPPLLFRDGVRLGTTDQWDVDMLFVVDAIEAVEVYGGGTGLPAEFWLTGSPCGVVAIWTRAPTVAPTLRPIHVIAQAGSRLAAGGPAAARVGAGLVVSLSRGFEIAPAMNLLVPVLGAGDQPSGFQALLTLRLRPLGSTSPWYVGSGATFLSLREPRPGFTDVTTTREQFSYLILSGVTIPLATSSRPFLELQVLDPLRPGRVEWHVFIGMAFRLH